MINNLSQLKSHPQQKIKGKDKGREMQTQGQHNDVLCNLYDKGREMQTQGQHKLLAPTRLRRTYFLSSFPDFPT